MLRVRVRDGVRAACLARVRTRDWVRVVVRDTLELEL